MSIELNKVPITPKNITTKKKIQNCVPFFSSWRLYTEGRLLK